ncbi:MAG TPA: DUF493 domain-containing protein [Pseudomonadales bacterium]|nr:DUF493 domain-containing protein [Pseudomonadales bacterium]
MSDTPEPPRIEFPCAYPIKVMGRNQDDFVEVVLAVGQRHAPEVTAANLTIRESRAGNWVSVTLTIEATGEAQLAAIFEDLKATGRVEMVL